MSLTAFCPFPSTRKKGRPRSSESPYEIRRQRAVTAITETGLVSVKTISFFLGVSRNTVSQWRTNTLKGDPEFAQRLRLLRQSFLFEDGADLADLPDLRALIGSATPNPAEVEAALIARRDRELRAARCARSPSDRRAHR